MALSRVVLTFGSRLLGPYPGLSRCNSIRTMIAGGNSFREQDPLSQIQASTSPLFLRVSLQKSEITLPQSQVIRMPSLIRIPQPWSTPSPRSYQKDILDPSSNLSFTIEAPTPVQEKKQAIRMIVIRRIKMNKHKLKKLRRKMKIVWAKVRLRRATWREKNFLNERMAQVKAAMKFDAKTHVAQLISNVRDRHVPEPWIQKGMPDSFVQEQLKIRAEEKKREFLSILDKRSPLKIK